MTAPRIRLDIDRLVLHGVDRADAAAVRRALGAALETMLAGADPASLAPTATSPPRLRLEIAPASGPAALGHMAGRALGAAIARGGGQR